MNERVPVDADSTPAVISFDQFRALKKMSFDLVDGEVPSDATTVKSTLPHVFGDMTSGEDPFVQDVEISWTRNDQNRERLNILISSVGLERGGRRANYHFRTIGETVVQAHFQQLVLAGGEVWPSDRPMEEHDVPALVWSLVEFADAVRGEEELA